MLFNFFLSSVLLIWTIVIGTLELLICQFKASNYCCYYFLLLFDWLLILKLFFILHSKQLLY